MKQHPRVELFHDYEEGGVHKQSYRPYAPYTRDQIEITRDRGDEQGEPTTGSATMSFPGHDLNPNNAASPLYGKVQQNTPLRILAGSTAALEDAFQRTLSDDWGDLDTDQTWTLEGGTVPGNYDVNGTEATQTHTTTLTYRISSVDTGSDDHLVRAIFDLSVADVTGNPITVQIRGRATDASNYYALEAQYATDEVVTLSLSKRVAGVGTVIASAVTVPFTGGSSGGNDMIGELYVEGDRIYAKVWYRYVDEPLEWMVAATDDDLTTGTLVALSGRRETGNTNTDAQIRWHEFLAVPGTIRFAGECASFKPRRALGDVEYGPDGVPVRGDRWVAVTANGVLRRMGEGEPPALSALWVENLRGDPIGMWPLNDGASATHLGSALPGGTPASIDAGTWEPRAVNTWVEPLFTPATGSFPTVEFPVRQPSTDTVWSGDFVFSFDRDATLADIAMEWGGPGVGSVDDPQNYWVLTLLDDSPGVMGYELSVIQFTGFSSSQTLLTSGTLPWLDGRLHHARLTTDNNGANTDWELFFDGTSVDSGTTAAPWDPMWYGLLDLGADTGQITVGFFTMWDTVSPPFNAANAAVVGRAGELAADRLERLCLENDDIPFELIGDSADTMPMGPQPVATFVEHVAEIERTESGRVYESRHQPGLTMRTRRSLLGQTARLTLDVDDDGVAPDLEPDVDLQGVVNDVTVVRTDGASARAIQEDGPLGINTIKRRPRSFDVNTEVDTDLSTHADWRLSAGTQRGTRYPQVVVDLVAAPDLETAAARVDGGDILALDNAEPDRAQLAALGYTETIGAATRQIAFNTGLGKVFDTGVYNDSASRYDSAYSTTTGTVVTGTTTSIGVAIEAGRSLWVTGSGSPQFPFEIEIEGARLSVTAISGATSPQTFTVTATPTNGVIKTIASGAQVRLAKPKRYGF